MQGEQTERSDSEPIERKKGALSTPEMQFIEQNHKTMTIEEMAQVLNRKKVPILKYLQGFLGVNLKTQKDYEVNAEYSLRRRPYWKELLASYETHELKLFIYHWKRIIIQFKNEVTPTEEIQIVDLIKMEIEQQRAQAGRKDCADRIRQVEDAARKLKKKNIPPEDVDERKSRDVEVANLEKSAIQYRMAYKEYGSEIKECIEQKNKLMNELKATRDQRLKKTQDSSGNFSLWLQQIYLDNDIRMKMSQELEKTRLASEKAKIQLSEYHKFEDGAIDQPLLTPDTVKEDNT